MLDICEKSTPGSPDLNMWLWIMFKTSKSKYGIKHFPLYLGNYPVDRVPCTASSYTTYGAHRESSSVYSVFHSSYDVCQDSCMTDSFCHGFTYNSDNQNCALSESSLPKYIDCAHCSFTAKDCSSTCVAHTYSSVIFSSVIDMCNRIPSVIV
jgi:hypothetical protein